MLKYWPFQFTIDTSNVVSWLVARFAIVPEKQIIILNPCIVWQVRYCGKKSSETMFFEKTCLSQKDDTFLQTIVLVCRSQKNQIAY